jgi:hypothetical protein
MQRTAFPKGIKVFSTVITSKASSVSAGSGSARNGLLVVTMALWQTLIDQKIIRQVCDLLTLIGWQYDLPAF